jgi:hypothetical protein
MTTGAEELLDKIEGNGKERTLEEMRKYGERTELPKRVCPECGDRYHFAISVGRLTKGLGYDPSNVRNWCKSDGVTYFHMKQPDNGDWSP